MIEVFEISDEEWEAAKDNQLADLGLTLEEIKERHRLGNMTYQQTKWWFMFGDSTDR